MHFSIIGLVTLPASKIHSLKYLSYFKVGKIEDSSPWFIGVNTVFGDMELAAKSKSVLSVPGSPLKNYKVKREYVK